MARRKKSSPAEDLMDLVAMLPWWAGIGLAIFSYVLLHRVALQPVSGPAQPGQVGSVLVRTLWTTLATVGQYALPLICLAGAAMSAWQRKKRRDLATTVTSSAAIDVLNGMTWREFEMLVGEGFRQQGYRVEEAGGDGPDGGVDLVLSRPGKNGDERFLVQCKQWRAFKVGVDVVRELYGAMAAAGAAGGFVVTSGTFTKEAVEFAEGRNLKLVDGAALRQLLQQGRRSVGEPQQRKPAGAAQNNNAESISMIVCPLCAKPMVMRTAKRGSNAGSSFWGCTGYPSCRGTRAVD